MAYAFKTIANLKDSISGMLTGLNLNNVLNLNTGIERSARELAQLIDIPDVQNRVQLTLYDGVTDYIPSTDEIYGAAIVDLRVQGTSRNETDFVYKQGIEQFDRTKGYVNTGYQVTFETINGVRRLRIATTVPTPKIELDPMTATTGWTAAGTASGLALDSTVFWQDPGALRFNLTAGTGTLTKTIPSNDLTNYLGVGVMFLAYRTPTAPTSITIRLGSDANNYYSVTVTSAFLGAFVTNQWDLASFDLSTATTVGSPVITAINYVEILVVAPNSINNFYVGDLWISLPSPHFLYYQSSSFFMASGASAPSRTITADTDSVILNDNAYVIFEHLCARNIADQQGGSGSADVAKQEEVLNGIRGYRGILIQPGLLDLYRADNPSQEIRQIGNFYDD